MRKLLLLLCLVVMGSMVQAAEKPNILIIWGDDIGQFNISAYNMGHDGLQDAQH